MAASRPNIWQLQARRDIRGLVDALQHLDPEIRKRAAVALRTVDAVQAVPALKTALEHETDPQTRSNLAAALHTLDHRTDVNHLIKNQDVQRLIRTLSSRQPEHAIAAARALGELDDRTAVEPLVMLFQNSSAPPRVRLAAAEALLALKSAPAVVTLLGALRRDSWEVRRNAAIVLGQIQAIWAVDPLAHALKDTHPVVRSAAAAALRRVGTADAIAALRAHFDSRTMESAPSTRPTPAPVAPQPVDQTPPDALPPAPPAAAPVLVAPPAPPRAETAPPPETPEKESLPVESPVSVPDRPLPEAAFSKTERRSKLMQSVLKLIALLKPHTTDQA